MQALCMCHLARLYLTSRRAIASLKGKEQRVYTSKAQALIEQLPPARLDLVGRVIPNTSDPNQFFSLAMQPQNASLLPDRASLF